MASQTQLRVANRIRVLREEQRLTQEDLADRLGFPSRQTISDIENGKRRVAPHELARAAQVLGVAVDYLTDAFRLVGEGEFSFRAEGADPDAVDSFQQKAGVWVATYRQLAALDGESSKRIGQRLELTPRSSFEDAQDCAEALRSQWALGEIPAATLQSAIRRELGTLVLFVDPPCGVSGAALRLAGLNAIFVNRNEIAGRRNFDLAHELFHLLTWEAMPPRRIEPRHVPARKGNRVEHLAENFAGALLMPRDVVCDRWEERGDEAAHRWLNVHATALGVTSVALKWRAVVLGLLSPDEARGIDDAQLAGNGGLASNDDGVPELFSADYVGRIHDGLSKGHLSTRRAARLLGLSLGRLNGLLGTYGLELHTTD